MTAVAALLLRSSKPELSFAVTIAGSVVILLLALEPAAEAFGIFAELGARTGIDSELIKVIVKIVAIGYLVEFAAGVVEGLRRQEHCGQARLCGEDRHFLRFAARAARPALADRRIFGATMIRWTQKRARAPVRAAIWAAAALLAIFLWMPFASAEEAGASGGKSCSATSRRCSAGLDTQALQDYLDSLTEEQKAFFGGSIADKIMAVIGGDLSLEYDSALGAIGSLVLTGWSGCCPPSAPSVPSPSCAGWSAASEVRLRKRHVPRHLFRRVFRHPRAPAVLADRRDRGLCAAAVGSMQAQMQAVFPLLLTLIATSGGSVSVAVYQPAVLFLSEIIVSLIAG